MTLGLGFDRTGPMWATRAYAPTAGIDHLGLGSVSADQILPALAPGINVLTPHPRYWSFYAFVLDEFWSEPRSRTRVAFKSFYRPWEAVFGFACQLCDATEHASILSGVVGSQRLGRLDPGDDFDPTYEYIESPLGGYGLYYRSVMQDVGLLVGPTGPISCDVPTPAGRAVGAAFRDAIAATSLYRAYGADLGSRRIPARLIREFARAACLCQLRTGPPDLPLLQDVFLHAGDPVAAARRRQTLRFVLDVALASPAVGLDEDAYRQLIYFRVLDGAGYMPAAATVATARRWRLYQAREYFAFALNRLWAWLVVRGLELTSGGLVTIPMADVRNLILTDVDRNTFAAQCSVADPGIRAAMLGKDFADWLAGHVDTSPGIDETWPAHETLDEHAHYRWCRNLTADPETLLAMLATLLLIDRRIGAADLGDDAVFLATNPERVPMSRFFGELQRRLRAGHSVGDLLWWIMEDLVITQHERVAMTKLPDDTFRFRRVAAGLRFFPQETPVGFNDSRFNSLRTVVHELDLVSSLAEPGRRLTASGTRLRRDGDLPEGALARAAASFEDILADVAAEELVDDQ